METAFNTSEKYLCMLSRKEKKKNLPFILSIKYFQLPIHLTASWGSPEERQVIALKKDLKHKSYGWDQEGYFICTGKEKEEKL